MTRTKIIAERTLLMQQPDGDRRIVVRIGAPYWVSPKEEAACSVSIEGLYDKLPDVRGVDLYQALELAMLLAQTLLASSEGHCFLWPDGRPYNLTTSEPSRRATKRRKSKS